jgi:hypothetical protein
MPAMIARFPILNSVAATPIVKKAPELSFPNINHNLNSPRRSIPAQAGPNPPSSLARKDQANRIKVGPPRRGGRSSLTRKDQRNRI